MSADFEGASASAVKEPAAFPLRIVFDGWPGPVGPRFIEVEDANGRSISAGPWRDRPDGLTELVITVEPPSPAVIVKPLEWGPDGVIAETPFGVYSIGETFEDSWTWTRTKYPYGEPSDPYETEAEAKAAAQADYEARILSALVGSGSRLADATKDLLEAKERELAEARDELIGERWHAVEAGRQRDLWKSCVATAERQRDEAMAALREEREACAKLAENVGAGGSPPWYDACRVIAQDIRARALSEVGTGEGQADG